MTLTIVARDERNGMFGVGVGAAPLLMAAVTVRAAPRVGLVVAQGVPNPYLAREVLAALKAGADAEPAIRTALAFDPGRDYRQLLVLDSKGNPAGFTGRRCGAIFGQAAGQDFVAGGNLMRSPDALGAMALSFERSGSEPLWERLLLALESGERAGGDRRGTSAAAIAVYGAEHYPLLDLRVEASPEAVAELRRLVTLWRECLERTPDFRATQAEPLPNRAQLDAWLRRIEAGDGPQPTR